MKRVLGLLALVLFAATLSAKDKKPKQELPDEILTARYVAVIVFNESNQALKQAEDLRTVMDVEQALRKWGKYKIAINIQDADFVIAVRRGRTETRIGVPVSRPGVSTEIEAAAPGGDMFAIFRKQLSGDPLDAPPVWRLIQNGILDPPDVSAVEKFKKAVEDSEKAKAGKP